MDKKIKNNYHQIRKSDKSKFYHHSMNFSASYFSTPGVLQGYIKILSANFQIYFDKF
jgi:hypothetical protein